MPGTSEGSNGSPREEAHNGHSNTASIFQQEGQQVRVYVPPGLKASLRARIREQIERHDGIVEDSKVTRSHVVLFDMDDAKVSRETFRLAGRQDPAIRVVPVSWVFDSVEAGKMCDKADPKYNPIACLEEYEKKKEAKASAGSAARSSTAEQDTARGAAASSSSSSNLMNFGRTPYDHIDRKHIVELLASKSKPWSALAVAKELSEKHGRHSVMSYQTRLRDHLNKGDNYTARVKAFQEERRKRREEERDRSREKEKQFNASEKSDTMSTPPRSADAKQDPAHVLNGHEAPQGVAAAASGSRSVPTARAPAATQAPTAAHVTAATQKAVTVATKPKFTPSEREALAHKLSELLKQGSAKGQDQGLRPLPSFWESFAEELPSHSAADWSAHHAKNAAMYSEVARLTLRLEATQTQPVHTNESDDEQALEAAHADETAAGPHEWQSNEQLSAHPSPSEATDQAQAKRRRIAEEAIALASVPSRSPPPNSTAVQQELAKKQYLREVISLRDEFGFVVVAQISPFLKDGGIKAARARLNELVERYEAKYALGREGVIKAIRQSGGRIKDAVALMESNRRM